MPNVETILEIVCETICQNVLALNPCRVLVRVWMKTAQGARGRSGLRSKASVPAEGFVDHEC